MNENEFSATPLPKAAKAVTPNRLDEVSNDWRRKVSLGLLLTIWSMVLYLLGSGLVARLEASTSGILIFWAYRFIASTMAIVSVWLIATTLPRSFGYWRRLGRMYRFFAIFSFAFNAALVPIWILLPDEAKTVNLPLTIVVLIRQNIGTIIGILGIWYMRKLAVIAGDSLVRKINTFFMWTMLIIAPLNVLMRAFEPETLAETVAKQIEKGFLPHFSVFDILLGNIFIFLFVCAVLLLFAWPYWRLYKRIRVRPGPVEAEQFAGDVDDEQSFGD